MLLPLFQDFANGSHEFGMRILLRRRDTLYIAVEGAGTMEDSGTIVLCSDEEKGTRESIASSECMSSHGVGYEFLLGLHRVHFQHALSSQSVSPLSVQKPAGARI